MSAIWYWAILTGIVCVPEMWLIASWYSFCSSASRWLLRHQDQHVAGDDLLRVEAVGRIDSTSASERPIGGRVRRAALRAQVGQAVVAAVVAQDRGVDRVAFEDALPEAVGELVDGGVGIGGTVTGRWPVSRCWNMRRDERESSVRSCQRPRQRPPKRSASRAAGVSSSWS